jgi:hypothetical protein
MKVYKNSDGSYDVINSRNELFHVIYSAKKIGHVTTDWKHHRRQLTRVPKHVMNLVNIIED